MNWLRQIFTPINIIGALLLAAAVYAKQVVSEPPPTPQAPQLRLEEVRPQSLPVYYLSPQLDYAKETRTVPVEGVTPGKIAQAQVAAWLKGPQVAGHLRVVPSGSDSPEVWLRGQHFVVNLPRSYAQLRYGAEGEHLLICTLTRTLLEKTGQDVSFLVGGEATSTLMGQIELRRPYTKADCPD